MKQYLYMYAKCLSSHIQFIFLILILTIIASMYLDVSQKVIPIYICKTIIILYQFQRSFYSPIISLFGSFLPKYHSKYVFNYSTKSDCLCVWKSLLLIIFHYLFYFFSGSVVLCFYLNFYSWYVFLFYNSYFNMFCEMFVIFYPVVDW